MEARVGVLSSNHKNGVLRLDCWPSLPLALLLEQPQAPLAHTLDASAAGTDSSPGAVAESAAGAAMGCQRKRCHVLSAQALSAETQPSAAKGRQRRRYERCV
jgi:hypothetical protein